MTGGHWGIPSRREGWTETARAVSTQALIAVLAGDPADEAIDWAERICGVDLNPAERAETLDWLTGDDCTCQVGRGPRDATTTLARCPVHSGL